MLKTKKISLGIFASLATITIPIIAVVSCTKTFNLSKKKEMIDFENWSNTHMKDGKTTEEVKLKFKGKELTLKKGTTEKDVSNALAKLGMF
ncbi:hypothetical protein [Mycoplasma todarodis]|uniref:hypothetical protein n=1 Tax=Mycoplasma todarodis TaxID=1937191 RepID=UPI003B326ABD